MKKPSKRFLELAKKASEIKTKLDSMKPLYEELDQITIEMAEISKPGRYEIPDFTVEIVDNFHEKNVCFRPAAVRRFEIKIERKAS